MASSKENEILHIDPQLLEEVEGHTAEIGGGQFGPETIFVPLQ